MSDAPTSRIPTHSGRREGQVLPRAADAVGSASSLRRIRWTSSTTRWSQGRGFKRILGITIEDIDYLEDAI